MKKKLFSMFLALGLVVSYNVSVLADPLSDMLKDKEAQEAQLNKDNTELKKTQDKLDEMENSVQMLDNKIEGLMRELDGIKKAIAKSDTDIAAAQKEVDKAQKDIEDQQKLFDKRMRAIYKSGNQGYLAIILKSQGISDLVSRIEAVNKIIQFDKKMVKELEDKKVVLQQKKEVLDNERNKQVALKADNEQKTAGLTATKADQMKLVKSLDDQRKTLSSKVKEREVAVANVTKKIKAWQDAAPRYDPSRGAAPATTSNIIAYAYNFLGTPYVWGGTSPNPGFDCSGYVQYVYAHFGIYLGRTTYDQIHEGVAVSRDQLQPGDLVFFGSWGDPHHVGFYVGDNCYLHAPQTGDRIKISPMTRTDYVTARRVLK